MAWVRYILSTLFHMLMKLHVIFVSLEVRVKAVAGPALLYCHQNTQKARPFELFYECLDFPWLDCV